MRIAFICGRLSRRASGVKVVVERLSAALQAAGHQVCVFGIEDAAWCDGDAAAWTGAPARVFATRGSSGLGFAPELQSAVAAFRPEIVHLHGIWMYGSVVSARLARRGVANLVSPHGMLDTWALRQSRLKKALVGWLFERSHLREAVALHALNVEEARAIRNFGLANPVAVLPNGVDLPNPEEPVLEAEWRARLPEGVKVLLYLGRLHYKKNLTALVEGFAVARAEPWHLVIAGPDQDGEEARLRALVAARGLSGWVHFIGPQFGQQKAASFAAADAFALPSLSEGLPMAVLEAWAARLPVLMSQECNLPAGFATGAALPTGLKAETIAAAIGKLLALAPEARATIGARGFALVERDYSWARLAYHFVTLYEWCRDRRTGDPSDFVQHERHEDPVF